MTNYPSDLTDTHGVARRWQLIEKMFDAQERSRKRKHSLRTVLNAIWYVVKGGVQWRMLPRHGDLRTFPSGRRSTGIIRSGKSPVFGPFCMIR